MSEQKWTPVSLAMHFHETYERLAPQFGYKTREASAKPWADVPDQNKQLMVAVCTVILKELQGDEELAALVQLYDRFTSIENQMVWGGSFEKEHGAAMEMKPAANKLFDEMLKYLAKRSSGAKGIAHNQRLRA